MKILDYLGLTTLIELIEQTYSKITHSHSVADLSDYTVDSAFSATSENPVQNKTVNNALLTIATDLDNMEESINNLTPEQIGAMPTLTNENGDNYKFGYDSNGLYLEMVDLDASDATAQD